MLKAKEFTKKFKKSHSAICHQNLLCHLYLDFESILGECSSSGCGNNARRWRGWGVASVDDPLCIYLSCAHVGLEGVMCWPGEQDSREFLVAAEGAF